MGDTLIDMLNWHSAEVERAKALWEGGYSRISGRVNDALTRKGRMTKFNAALRRETKTINDAMVSGTETLLEQSATKTRAWLKRLLPDESHGMFKGDKAKSWRGQIAVVQEVSRQYLDAYARDVNARTYGRMRIGQIQGLPQEQIIESIKRVWGAAGAPWGNGTQKYGATGASAEVGRLVNTEIARVRALTVSHFCEHNDNIIGVQVIFGGGPCNNKCQPKEGIYYFPERAPFRGKGNAREILAAMPFHPNCRCLAIPITKASVVGQLAEADKPKSKSTRLVDAVFKPTREEIAAADEWFAGRAIAAFKDPGSRVKAHQALSKLTPETADNIYFVGTVSELNAWARATGNIYADPGLERVNRVWQMVRHKLDEYTLGGNAPAAVTMRRDGRGIIVVNPQYASPLKAQVEMAKWPDDWSACKTFDDLILHEGGHVESQLLKKAWPTWQKGYSPSQDAYSAIQIWEMAWRDAGPNAVATTLGRYAADTASEAWSELRVLMNRGVKLPDWINEALDRMEFGRVRLAEQLAHDPWERG